MSFTSIYTYTLYTNTMDRCQWADNDPLYTEYHDKEWGTPIYDDDKIFEFLILETFQAGLSWITILRKRDNFRQAFDNFDFKKIAKYSEDKVASLMNNAGIIRNERKIRATVANAKAFLKVRDEFGSFSNYIWDFVGGKPIVNRFIALKDIPAKTPLSDKISKDLKKRGFKFVGSTIIYSHMQATGLVNDHLTYCRRHKELGG